MVCRIEKYLLERIRKEGCIHMTLIDPEKVTSDSACQLAKDAESCNTGAIMVGGSTSISSCHLDNIAKSLKDSVDIPVILFPNNIPEVRTTAETAMVMTVIRIIAKNLWLSIFGSSHIRFMKS